MDYSVPRHIAIIMDGNGRWAKSRGLPRILGHRAGARAVRAIVEQARALGVEALTLYAFSWENWDRPKHEIRLLMGLLDLFIRREAPRMISRDIRLKAIGRLDELPRGPRNTLERVISETQNCASMTLTLALSYGGRQEIVDATRRLADRVREGSMLPEEIDEKAITQELYTSGLPDPDLLIRTSGEQRLSNFLLWQTSYTELYITPKYWPDFSAQDLEEAIADYGRRERRFGKTLAAA